MKAVLEETREEDTTTTSLALVPTSPAAQGQGKRGSLPPFPLGVRLFSLQFC